MTKRLLIGIAGTLVLAAAWSLAAHEAPDATIELSAELLPDGATGALENDRGVDIRLHSALQGERLEPPLLGVQMKLERGAP